MAVPDSVTLYNLTGNFDQNKTLSDDPDAILAMQGVSWFVRKAVKYSSIVLHVEQWKDDEGVVHIDIEQVSTGGFKNFEERALDWTMREKDDKVFGKVQGRTKFMKIDDVEDAYLKDGWDKEWLDKAHGEVISAYAESVGKNPNWTADQIWGFEQIDGGRRYVRHIIARKGSEVHKIKTVYDWKP